MAEPTLPYTLTNGTTANASEVQSNDQALLDAITDGTKDIECAALTTTGSVTLGNSSTDTVTFNASLGSHVVPATTFLYDLGSSTIGMRDVYFGSADSAARTTKIRGATVASSYTLTLPTTGGTAGHKLRTDGSGTTSWAGDIPFAITATVAASALTVALKGADGNDPSATNPVDIAFRNATATTGTPSFVAATAATSVVVSSGSTLGHKSAIPHFIYVYALNNAGTIELAVSSVRFDDGSVQSTTAEGGGGAADSNRVLYSTTARANVAVRLLGRLTSTQAAAGTWATAISEISLPPFQEQVIHASYKLTASTANASIADSSDEILDYDTKVSDTHNIVTVGASWAAVIPRSGFYLVEAALASGNDAWTVGEVFQIKFYVGGAESCILAYLRVQETDSFAANTNGSKVLYLAAGDSVDFRGRHTQGGSLNIDTGTDGYVRCGLTYIGPRLVTS
jgi:hypothetical protein